MPSESFQSLYDALKAEFSNAKCDVDKCTRILEQLKPQLIERSFIVPKEGKEADPKDLVVARDCLEIGAICSIRMKNVTAFERYMNQLFTYYNDYKSVLPASPRMYPLLGLNLLRFLAQNRIAEFHTSLELIDCEQIKSNAYIKHPVQLEQHLMEGGYNKVFNARSDVPAPEYSFFVEILMGTIRQEIANSMEKAYETMSIPNAASLLFYKDQREVNDFITKRGWNVSNNTISFIKKNINLNEISNHQVISQTLSYAKELEKIV